MSVHHLFDMTWDEVGALDGSRTVALLPIGAIEAHGPHLPLATDVIISEAMVRVGADALSGTGFAALILPTWVYTPASFAKAFPGTLHVSGAAFSQGLRDIGDSLLRHGITTLALANSHFDPQNIRSIYEAKRAMPSGLTVVFPDVTRKPWALRLSDEFKSGAAHAGRYEGSIVLAERPDLVNEGVRHALPEVPVSLSEAIRDGQQSFAACGAADAYVGAPAEATAEEGRETVETLGNILADAVHEAVGQRSSNG